MAIQAVKLVRCLEEGGFLVVKVPTNPDFPARLSFIRNIPVFRTLVNTLIFLGILYRGARSSDVVYFLSGFFNFFFWITFPGVVLCKLVGTPIILSARGGAAREFFSKWKGVLRPVVRRINLVTTPSGFLQEAFVDAFNVTPVIVPNIADVEQFIFLERDSFAPKLIVSRSLEEIYNVGCVIRAFRKVKDRFPEATLAVVGDGTERPRLEELVRELDLEGAVTFHGGVDHTRMQKLYAENDIAVNASTVDNLPGTILEAYASGLPVVTTRAGGIPYMVEDGVTGLLVDVNDCNALASRVVELLENPELARSLASNGRQECEKYTADRVGKTLAPLLLKFANERKA